MRTKTLLLTAAVTAVGIATSMAQVFSVNTVGYVRRTIPPGFSMLANPLQNGANKISELFAGVPDGFGVYTYNQSAGSFVINFFSTDFGWDDPDQVLNPGTGMWVFLPVNKPAQEVTFIGEVLTGQQDVAIGTGDSAAKKFNLVGSKIPQAGKLDADLQYNPDSGDIVYLFRRDVNGDGKLDYEIYSYDQDFGWDEDPTINVADGLFIFTNKAKTWARNFTVN